MNWFNYLIVYLFQTKDKQIKRMIASYVGENQAFANQFLKGQIELEFVPQGIKFNLFKLFF